MWIAGENMKNKRVAVTLFVVFAVVTLAMPFQVFSVKAAGSVVYTFSIDPTLHNTYGLTYPVTYEFTIPSSASNLDTYRRFTTSENWVQMAEKTSSDFFNGIEAVRFDYTNHVAYVSIAFASYSDNIYICFSDSSGNSITTSYQGTAQYYDNRRITVCETVDDLGAPAPWGSGDDFSTCAQAFADAKIWWSGGVITGAISNWAALQDAVNLGYFEVASHSRTHPTVPYADYDSEIGGSKSDILNNLQLNPLYVKGNQQYVWCWIEPSGQSDDMVQQTLAEYNYLISREATGPWGVPIPIEQWNSTYGIFNRTPAPFDLDGDNSESYPLATMNEWFDSVYNGPAGGLYLEFCHIGKIDWSVGGAGYEHLQYMSGKTDVWYVGLGALYAYQFTTLFESETSGSQMSVTVNPTSVSMDIGQQQTFTSTVTGGNAPYSYQWYLNGNSVLGATGSTWTFAPATAGSFNVYVSVTDNDGTDAQSNIVTDIVVYAAPSVSISPTSVNMDVNSTQQFTSTVTGGSTPYTYRWYYTNGTVITGATASTLTYKANSTGTNNIYLNVTDSLSYRAQSNTATINAYAQPSVIISPTSVNINIGATQPFTSTTTGGLIPYTYQWYLNDTAQSGATTNTWNFTPAAIGHYKVYLNVTDTLNSKVQSNIVTDITVSSQMTVTITPTAVNMTVDTPQTFTSTVSGGNSPYTYQWYLNGTLQSGTGSTWTFNSTVAGTYIINLTVTDSHSASAHSNNAVATDHNWSAGLGVHAYAAATISPSGLSPTQIRKAYNLPSTGGSGTIAIIDAYDDPTVQSDFVAFSNQYGLPTNNLEVHKMASTIANDSGWDLEISLDVQWAHAIAPNAHILLVEAQSSSLTDLLAAVSYATGRSDVVAVSMSWGSTEFSGETLFDSYFTSTHGIVFFASAGDHSGVIWPSSSPNVIGVGGTSLTFNGDGSVASETVWNDSFGTTGGGASAYETEPAYQTTYGVSGAGGMRAVPDVSYDADPASGMSVYDSTSYNGQTGWFQVGGTSAGAPQWAAIHSLSLSCSDTNFYQDAKSSASSYFRDITSGSNGVHSAAAGYDYVTGLGSPITSNFNAHATSAAFDFGTSTSPVQSGYTQVTESTLYSANLGYGWTTTTALNSRDRGSPDNLTRDFVFSPTTNTFNVDLANGNYQITVTIGDQAFMHDQINVYAQNTLVINSLTVPVGTFQQVTFTTTITNGQLNLTIQDGGGTDPNWVINALTITAPNPSPTQASFDFGTSSSPVQTGYTQVTESTLYSANLGYGWTTTTALNSRDRGSPDNLTRDFVFSPTTNTFNVDLANGNYNVTIIIGDQNYMHDDINVYAQNTLVVNSLTVAAGTFQQVTFTTTITNGQLNLTIQDGGGTDPNWVINALTIGLSSPPPTQASFDFGTSSSPVQTGYTQVTESTLYSANLGYGWNSTVGLDSRDRGSPDNLRRDFVFSSSDHTFNVDLANGNYNVTIIIGDQNYMHDDINVYAQNTLAINNLTTAASTFQQVTFTTTITNGQLNLRIRDNGGTDSNWVINALTITAAS